MSASGGATDDFSPLAFNFTIPAMPNYNASSILEPALTKRGNAPGCLLLFRSATGAMWKSQSSSDCKSWGPTTPDSLENPNSRANAITRNGLVYVAGNFDNEGISEWPAWGVRRELTVVSGSAGSWSQFATVEEDDSVTSYCYPALIARGTKLHVAYSAYETNVPRIGIKIKTYDLQETISDHASGQRFIVFAAVVMVIVGLICYFRDLRRKRERERVCDEGVAALVKNLSSL